MATKSTLRKAVITSRFWGHLGQYVVNVSNNETLFLAILRILINGEENSAEMIWYSQKSTVGRLELVLRISRDQHPESLATEKLEQLAEQFKSLSRLRNFYCHASYTYEDDGNLNYATGATFRNIGTPIKITRKKITKGVINSIIDTMQKLTKLNGELWQLINDYEKLTDRKLQGSQKPPPSTHQYLASHPHLSRNQKPS